MRKKKAHRIAAADHVTDTPSEGIARRVGPTDAAWEPTLDCHVTVYPDTDQAVAGRVVEDFGEFDPHPVEANNVRIAEAARRWAVLTVDGDLVFAHTYQLSDSTATSGDPR